MKLRWIVLGILLGFGATVLVLSVLGPTAGPLDQAATGADAGSVAAPEFQLMPPPRAVRAHPSLPVMQDQRPMPLLDVRILGGDAGS